jgi:hypothetical protein
VRLGDRRHRSGGEVGGTGSAEADRRTAIAAPGTRARVLAALAVTAIAIPLLLWGWRAWPQSAVALGLTFIVPVGWRKVIESGNWLVFRLAALALGIIIYEGALIWDEARRRLLEVGGASRGLAFCMSTLTVILVVSLFVVGVWEAVMRLVTWSQGRTRPSWLVVTGISGAVVVVLKLVSEWTGMPLWYIVPGLLMATIAAGLYLLWKAEGGEGHLLLLLVYVMLGATGIWFLYGLPLGPQIASSCPPFPDTRFYVVVRERASCVLDLLFASQAT